MPPPSHAGVASPMLRILACIAAAAAAAEGGYHFYLSEALAAVGVARPAPAPPSPPPLQPTGTPNATAAPAHWYARLTAPHGLVPAPLYYSLAPAQAFTALPGFATAGAFVSLLLPQHAMQQLHMVGCLPCAPRAQPCSCYFFTTAAAMPGGGIAALAVLPRAFPGPGGSGVGAARRCHPPALACFPVYANGTAARAPVAPAVAAAPPAPPAALSAAEPMPLAPVALLALLGLLALWQRGAFVGSKAGEEEEEVHAPPPRQPPRRRSSSMDQQLAREWGGESLGGRGGAGWRGLSGASGGSGGGSLQRSRSQDLQSYTAMAAAAAEEAAPHGGAFELLVDSLVRQAREQELLDRASSQRQVLGMHRGSTAVFHS